MTLAGDVLSNQALSDQIVLGINNFRKGVTAPADGTLGTTPTTPTLLFAATNELLTVGTVMPFNWDRTVDVTLVLWWSLAAVEVNGDTLDVTVDYTVPLDNTGAAGPDKASTQVTGQITAVTGRLAVADVYRMDIPLARADANNPYTSADAMGFVLEMHLTNVTGVASAHFLGACIGYERLH
jgi:hypothetical protein